MGPLLVEGGNSAALATGNDVSSPTDIQWACSATTLTSRNGPIRERPPFGPTSFYCFYFLVDQSGLGFGTSFQRGAIERPPKARATTVNTNLICSAARILDEPITRVPALSRAHSANAGSGIAHEGAMVNEAIFQC